MLLVPDRVERRSDRQLIGWLRHPRDLRRHAKQPIVVVIHPVQIEPDDRLGKGLERRQVEKLRAAKGLHADAAGELPVVRPLIVGADIADTIRMDLRQRRIDIDPGVLEAGEKPLGLILVQRVVELDDIVERGCLRCFSA